MTNGLILTSLEKAIVSFERAICEYENNQNEFVRDSCIQRFEYCYDLSHKMLKRYLERIVPNPADVNEYTFQDLIRTGYAKGILLNSWDEWRLYRDNRNATSHGYDEDKALEIVAQLPNFLTELKYLLEHLQNNND